MADKPRVLITHWVHDQVIDALTGQCEIVRGGSREGMTRAELLSAAANAEAIICFGSDVIDRELLAAAPKLRIVAGTTTAPKNVDLDACTARGVWYTVVPDMRTVPAAELALGLLIGLARMMPEGDRFIRSGQFKGWRADNYGTGLAGKTIGIIGMGALGRATAKRLAGFDMQLLYADPNPLTKDREYALNVERKSLEDLLALSDFVMLCVPLLPATRGMISAAALKRIKKGAYLVNISRGSVVDETAVNEALQSGRLLGYAADVFAMEDASYDDKPETILPALQQNSLATFFTPHIGSAVDDVRMNITLDAAQNVIEALSGARPHGAANQPAVAQGTTSEPFF